MRTLCFHHDDEDGRASAAIVRHALGAGVILVEVDYDDRAVPWHLVAQAEHILVVDFSFPLEEMQRMAQGRRFTWIDHHQSALTVLGEAAAAWEGSRDLAEAACVLTWRHFFPDRPMPYAITLIGDRDIWRWAEADTGAFTEELHVRDTRPDNDALWQPLLAGDAAMLDEIIRSGQRLRQLNLAHIRHLVASSAFPVLFEGLRTLVVNAPGNGDLGQHGRDLGFEIVYCYWDRMQRGILTTQVSLFSRREDVSLIARRYGGGGHVNAAGFSFPRAATPFPPDARVTWLDETLPDPTPQEENAS